jgi:hypothetical protein
VHDKKVMTLWASGGLLLGSLEVQTFEQATELQDILRACLTPEHARN